MHLYEQIHQGFGAFCRSRAYGVMDPKDLMSESILIALENFDKIKDKKAFKSYLFSIAINQVRNAVRTHKRRTFTEVEKQYDLEDKSVSSEVRYDVQILYKLIYQLPDPQKEALILFEISGFSIKEIAQMQDTSESSVKQRLRRSRLKLKEWMKDEIKESA